ncbi:phycobiliprotein lyase [Prochlorococcus sp. MIT 1223]|uniref:phycobiliprotein lyase n=1 Tax=Prochlorococcus sp. MIT 1223 TaxID=3096217 RepID=UPI002A759285|nr:phycobiliprotein lyase [Prochlorococcus sp. MIT 1223]
MKIENFIKRSEGNWKSMRSGHSLAFKQFEEIVSDIRINLLSVNDNEVLNLVKKNNISSGEFTSPFIICWEAESNWEEEKKDTTLNGSCVIVPVPISEEKGIMLRSSGYVENIETKSEYEFLEEGTILLSTNYNKTIAEERIWFISENLRCRSSVIKSSGSNSILQTSYASEIRRLNNLR